MKKYIYYLFLITSTVACADEKVLIITHSYSRPDFIETQHKCFKSFLKDDYTFMVFNDAPNESMSEAIESTCKKLNIECMRVPQNRPAHRETPSYRHMDGIHYALNTVGFDHDGIVFMVDSDMFLIKPFCVNEYLKGYDLVGDKQFRPHTGPHEVVYISPLTVFMNMKTLPNKKTMNFTGDMVEGQPCDVGGHLYYYIKDNPSLRLKFSTVSCIAAFSQDAQKVAQVDDLTKRFLSTLIDSFDDNDPHRMQFHVDNHFIHYVAGSNWNYRSHNYHQKKTSILNSFIDASIEYYKNNNTL